MYCDHPNIIKLYEVYEEEQRFHVVTQLCTGGELFERIMKYKYIDEQQAAHVIKQVLQALSYCHSKNLVHRDIKPENILFESEAENSPIRIIDFGMSTYFDPLESMHTSQGTPFYVAPEVLKKEYSEKCDVWSTGVVLYMLLCGQPPFFGKAQNETLRLITRGSFSFNQQI